MTPGHATISADWRGTWYVGHTKSRMEKAFAWDMLAQGIMYFLPMVEITNRLTKRTTHEPIFKSYVSFVGGPEERYAALATNRLCQVIEVPLQQRFIGELIHIQHRVLTDPDLVKPVVRVNQVAAISRGALMGETGPVCRLGKNRVYLTSSMLGGAEIETDTSSIEAA